MIYYVLQYQTGQYLYIHYDMELYPCELHEAEIFIDKLDAERFAKSHNLFVRKIVIEVLE